MSNVSSDPSPRVAIPAPPLVAMAGWLVPGLGYWLIGERARGLTVGVTIIALFVFGLLIGGVRVVEVPGYNRAGEKIMLKIVDEHGQTARDENGQAMLPRWIMTTTPFAEIRNKPWSIAQVLTGPMGIVAAWGSVKAADAGPNADPPGAESHARVNEIAVLYTAVAGMLNLLAMIDSAHRAGEILEAR